MAEPCQANAEGFVLTYDDDAAEFLKNIPAAEYAKMHLTLQIVTAAQGQYWLMMELQVDFIARELIHHMFFHGVSTCR